MKKIVLITGGSRGIGAATVTRLASEGADVAINYANNKEAAESIASDVLALGRKAEIYQACREMVALEDRFLDLVFEQGDIEGLTKAEMMQYIRYIADRRLLQLGLKPNYNIKDNPLDWLDDVLGVEHQNFFEGRATTYMKAGMRGDVGKVKFADVA